LKNINKPVQLLLVLIFFAGCAKMGYLEGGKKDINPPRLISSRPLNYSSNFKGQKIELDFDEYIVLKNPNQELIISPPLPKKPDVRIKNKSIIIDLKNELRENTTYTLNFGKAIADNNEGNLLTNFEFVFSTGSYLDSLSVKGTILNSFNLQPSKESIIIGLYDQLEDSVPLKSIPVYVGKTDDKGLFMINNVKADTFKIFALKDLNNNLIFDLPNEEIAFIDTVIYLTPAFLLTLPARISESDTARKDSLLTSPVLEEKVKNRKGKEKEQINETIKDTASLTSSSDSIVEKPGLPPVFVDLFYFVQDATKLYMTNKEKPNNESFQISFSLPIGYEPRIRVLDYDNSVKWNLPEINSRRDTFTYWLTDTTLINADTLRLEAIYPMTDSTGSIITRTDTIQFFTRKQSQKQGKGKTEEKAPVVKLIPTHLRNNATLDLNSDFTFRFNFPLQDIDTSQLKLFARIDTVERRENYVFQKDSLSYRKIDLKSNWKEKTKYRIQAFPGAFTDIYGHTNDTLQTTFTTQQKSFYGTLTISVSNVGSPLVIQLMNEKETILRTAFAETDGSYVFEYLPPAKYKVKFVFDSNGNRKWDTGNYLKKKQPEKIMYYKGEINVRSNWELEIKQDIETP